MKISKLSILLLTMLSSSILSANDNEIDSNENINVSVKFINNQINFTSEELGESHLTSQGIDLSVSFVKENRDKWVFGINFLGEDTEKFGGERKSTASFLIPHAGYEFVYTNLNTDTSLILGPELNILVGDYEETYITSNAATARNSTTSIGVGVSFKIGFSQKINDNFNFEMSYSAGISTSNNKFIDTDIISSFSTGINYKF
jgi:hypothetical protein